MGQLVLQLLHAADRAIVPVPLHLALDLRIIVSIRIYTNKIDSKYISVTLNIKIYNYRKIQKKIILDKGNRHTSS